MLCGRGGRGVRVAMVRIRGDENVPAQVVEPLGQVVELLRAVGEPVQQYQRTLGALAVDVQASAANGVDVGSIERLEAVGALNSSFVRVAGHSRYGILGRGVAFDRTPERRTNHHLSPLFSQGEMPPSPA